jgi:F-type H+-transporting ATPase subunit c
MDMVTRPNTKREFQRSDGAKSAGAAEHSKEESITMLTPIFAQLTGNLHIAAAAAGAAIGVGMIGMKASEAVGRNPGAATKILVQAILSTAFAEGIVFFAIFLARGQ